MMASGWSFQLLGVFYPRIFRKARFTCILFQAVLLESLKRILTKTCLRCHIKLRLDGNSLIFFFNCLFLPRAFSYATRISEVHSHATQPKSPTDFPARQLNQGNVQLPIQHLSKIKWTKKKILLLLSLGEAGLSPAEKKGKEDKKGRERLARKHAEGLEKNDKGNFTEQDDFFFFSGQNLTFWLITSCCIQSVHCCIVDAGQPTQKSLTQAVTLSWRLVMNRDQLK